VKSWRPACDDRRHATRVQPNDPRRDAVAVEEAHNAGRTVAAHAKEGKASAMRSCRVDSIEHVTS